MTLLLLKNISLFHTDTAFAHYITHIQQFYPILLKNLSFLPIHIVVKNLYPSIFCVYMARRLIVAIYEKGFPFVLPINPVNEIHRITPQSRQPQNSTQNQNASFAAMLDAMMHTEDPENTHEFSSYA